jgi:protoporphyrin/coproporphyrin ferrochelatase
VNQAVLLLAHGAPERLDDIEAYLSFVRGGRPSNAQVTEEVTRRYTAIGGGSPLLRWTRAQAEALERLLGVPVHIAMRNWHPFIQDVVPRIDAHRVAAVCLAPQYSEMSIGIYIRKVAEAAPPFEIRWAKSYHDEPLLIEAFAERLGRSHPRVLFTAHSLPERALAPDDPYDRECRATAALVAGRLGLAGWDFAYQSQGMTGERWLGPTVESFLDRYAACGIKEVAIAPIGFVCDHVEILYDIDIQFRDYAAARGITVTRPESLNDSPLFTAALAEVVKRCL